MARFLKQVMRMDCTGVVSIIVVGLGLLFGSCSGLAPPHFMVGDGGSVDTGGDDTETNGADSDTVPGGDGGTGDCVEGDRRQGESPCGMNHRGVYMQDCVDGKWQDIDICDDDDVCIDDATRIGDTPCDENDAGRLEQKCVEGNWEDTLTCIVGVECEDGETRLAGSCGDDGKGQYSQECIDGAWEDPGTCVHSVVCIEGNVRLGDEVCGAGTPPRGNYYEECIDNEWVQTECYDRDLDIGGPCECMSQNCDVYIPIVNMRMKYFWDIDIKGCDLMIEKYGDWPNTEVACMRSQTGTRNPQYWANGYCTMVSVGCSGNSMMCNLIPTGGEYKNHTTCPPGTVMLEEVFVTNEFLYNFTLFNKLCLQPCVEDDDCRHTEMDPIHNTQAPLYTCFKEDVDGETIGYCWDDQNVTSPQHKVTQF